jgi:hypothetical protein
MKALRHTAAYALVVLACMSSAAWQPEPAAEFADCAVRIAQGESPLDLEVPPMP